MNGKMMAGIGLAVGIVAIALLAAPIQAYVNGNDNDDMLQTQTQERLKLKTATAIVTCFRCKNKRDLGHRAVIATVFAHKHNIVTDKGSTNVQQTISATAQRT